MPEIKLILSATPIQIGPGVFKTCWFLDLKYGNCLTDITNGSYDHCLEQKRHWQSVIDRGEIKALIPSCRPPAPRGNFKHQKTMNNDTAFERRPGDLTHSEILGLFEAAKGSLHLRIERDPGTHKIAFQILDVWDATADEWLVGWDFAATGTIDTRLNPAGEWVTELAWAVLEECRDSWASVTELDNI